MGIYSAAFLLWIGWKKDLLPASFFREMDSVYQLPAFAPDNRLTMKLLFDFFPIILFFIAYKIAGIYIATAVAISVSFIQLIGFRLVQKKWDRMQLTTFALIAVLGGATLFLHDDLFIKWKPTVVNWLFALIFFLSPFFGGKPLLQRLMEKNIQVPWPVWRCLNISWIVFFTLMGALNLYIVYHFSTEVWVNFKLFGMLGLTLAFVVGQAFYLSRFISDKQA